MSGSVSGILAAVPSGQQAFDPLKTFSTIGELQNRLVLNKVLQQDVENKAQEYQNLQLQNEQGQQSLAEKKLNVLSGAAYGILLTAQDHPEMLTPDFVRSKVDAIAQHFPGMADDVKKFEANLTPDDTPTSIAGKLSNIVFAGVGPVNSQALAGKQGTIATQDQSGRPVTVGTWTPGAGMPGAGQLQTVGPGVPMTLTPSEASSRVPVGRDPITGAEQTAPLGTVTPRSMGGMGDNAPPAPATSAPPSGGQTAGNQPPPAPPAPKPLPGQVTTGLPADWDASVKQGINLNVLADQQPQIKANLANMQADLARINSMGASTEKETEINSFIQKWAGFGITMTRDQVAAADSFKKLATQVAMAQAAAAGATDTQTMTAMMANPNLDLSKLSNEQILARMQGNADWAIAKNAAWNEWKQTHGQGSYANFSQWFNHQVSPLVFQHENMAAGDRQSFREGIPGGPSMLRKQREFAIEHGWLTPGGQ